MVGVVDDVFQIIYLVSLELKIFIFFFFFVKQELADPDLEKGEKSVFYLLLKMFVSTNSSYLKTSTRMLVLKVSSLHTPLIIV